MPDLQNLLRHMFGKSVLVDGTTYTIDAKGIAHKVKAKDAKKMLKGKSWKLAKGAKSTPEPDPEPALLDDDGKPIEDPENTEETGTETDPEQLEETDPETEETGTDTETKPEQSIEELKSMADELGVSYGPNIGAALLLQRIEEATTTDPGSAG